MLASIITPTHSVKNIPYLLELYESILDQTYTNWEWVLYLNGSITAQDLPETIKGDSRVKIHKDTSINTNVGYLKNCAFNLGSGDVLIEVDHDDIITPDCVESICSELLADDSIGFVHSHDAIYHMQNAFLPYSESFGWTHKTVKFRDMELFSMNPFTATSHSVAFIWYSPDHVRAWRTSVYKEIGGHNPDLSVCDDHELMIRTYLVTKFKKIDKVLYVYRITGDNTWLERNALIQSKTVELFHQYARQLAERDCELRGLLKIDIGGGINGLPGYITIDQEGAHINCDLNDGIPLNDNSVGIVNASHIIEHLYDKTKTMSEIHRVLAHGGWAFIDVPSTDGRGAFQDPTHVSYWNENSFLYYTDANLAKYIRNTTIRFQSYRMQTWFPNEWLRSINVPIVTAWLAAVKPDGARLPSLLKI